MAEPHLKTAGVSKYARHQEDVSVSAITPAADVTAEFKQLKMRRKSRFVLFRIEGAEIVVDSTGPPTATFRDFLGALPDLECRYAVYDHEFVTPDGRKSSKLFFVTWIPQSSNPNFKMAYTHAKPSIRAVCEGCIDLNAVMKTEIEEGMGVNDGAGSDSDSEFDD
ncbi:hypothetical protein P43SY_002725 [Pythium insidiosum]|uniref:ADF-H domain-containing protein n=1 Tax=Pythium insidiosum TaxID=114742 RepID=A0AAD5QDF4_PYTIN|nr:hypothetical protein P43SY_002725 [Pythium insidiosum]KAJ0412855.1 hypothetical protein ATCC90586_002485 [Pythium insidiosum]